MVKKGIILLLCALISLFVSAKSPVGGGSPVGDASAAGDPSASPPQGDSDSDDLEKAPDFTLPDKDGGEFTLSSTRGQYVVLDFWGTWCAVCIKSIPKMKEYYAKCLGKVMFIGVSCGDSPESWKQVCDILKLPWKNVQVGRDNSVSRMYHVSGFPTKVIIDPEGNVVKKFVGEDPRFYAVLDKLLK